MRRELLGLAGSWLVAQPFYAACVVSMNSILDASWGGVEIISDLFVDAYTGGETHAAETSGNARVAFSFDQTRKIIVGVASFDVHDGLLCQEPFCHNCSACATRTRAKHAPKTLAFSKWNS